LVGFQSLTPIRFARTPVRAPCPTHAIIRQINATLLIRIMNIASQILLVAGPRMTVSSGDPRYRPVADLRNIVLLYQYCGAGSVTEGCPWPVSRSLKRGVRSGREQLGLRSQGLQPRPSQAIRPSVTRAYVGHFSINYIRPYKFK